MKNYEENFKAENKILLDQMNSAITLFKQKVGKRQFLVAFIGILFIFVVSFLTLYLIAGWEFLGFGISPWFPGYHTSKVDGGATIFATLAISVIIAIVVGNIQHSIISRYEKATPSEIIEMNKKLEEKAKAFVLRTYLQDVLGALTTKFMLTHEFKEHLRAKFEDQTWFDKKDGALLIGGFSFHYLETGDEELFTIHHEGCIYYLTSWDYPKSGFRFFLEKIHPDGRVEELEYELPSKN